jgi:hypothetical protein
VNTIGTVHRAVSTALLPFRIVVAIWFAEESS